MKKNLAYIGLASLIMAFASCESGDNEFPDFDYQTVYFANQYGLRTIELGESEFVDNTLDNQHKLKINAAWGGGYTNRRNVIIDFKIDESLCDNLYFKSTNQPLVPMPASYYKLASDQITIPQGQIMAGVEVQLTDAFFADEKSTGENYVIPLLMTAVQGADSILQGKAVVENPVLTNSGDWSVQPQNFVLYAVKYVNPWHGEYLRRGVDHAAIGGVSKDIVRHEQFVENDEVVNISTKSLKDNLLPLKIKDAGGKDVSYTVRLTFTDDGTCTLSSGSEDVVVSGSGKFVRKGEKNSLGGKDRNALYLDYTVNLTNNNIQVATKDTLVLRTRNVQGGISLGVVKNDVLN